MKICSYFGNKYLHHFEKDLEEIVEHGFDTILFPISESAWKYSLGNIRDMGLVAERAGLETIASPWGIAELFSGEAVSSLSRHDSMLDRETMFREWCLDVVVQAGFTHVMLDEPRVDNIPRFCARAYEGLSFDAIKVSVCLSDDAFDWADDGSLTTLLCDSLHLGTFHWIRDLERVKQRTSRLSRRLHSLAEDAYWTRPTVWLQGFDIPGGNEAIPRVVHDTAWEEGIRDFGFWGFRACEATSSKTPTNPGVVWWAVPTYMNKHKE